MQLLTGDETNGFNSEEKLSSVLPTGLVSQETLILLNSLGKGSIDDKLKRILNEKREQFEQIVKLKSELDEEKNRLRTLEKQIPKLNESHQNLNASNDAEQVKTLTKEITDLKNRLQRLEADNVSIQQEVKHFLSEKKDNLQVFLIRINDMMLNLKGINNKQMMLNVLKKI
jgi:chromosome segregation ATPase